MLLPTAVIDFHGMDTDSFTDSGAIADRSWHDPFTHKEYLLN